MDYDDDGDNGDDHDDDDDDNDDNDDDDAASFSFEEAEEEAEYDMATSSSWRRASARAGERALAPSHARARFIFEPTLRGWERSARDRLEMLKWHLRSLLTDAF